jgi:hypothetical protein
MRRQHRKYRIRLRSTLLSALSILSHVAAIIGTIVAAVDALHHW